LVSYEDSIDNPDVPNPDTPDNLTGTEIAFLVSGLVVVFGAITMVIYLVIKKSRAKVTGK